MKNDIAIWSFGSDTLEITGNARATQVEHQHATQEARSRMLSGAPDFQWVQSGTPEATPLAPEHLVARPALQAIRRLTGIRFRVRVSRPTDRSTPVILHEWLPMPPGASVGYDPASQEWRWQAESPFPLRGLILATGEQVICMKSREGRWRPFTLRAPGAHHV